MSIFLGWAITSNISKSLNKCNEKTSEIVSNQSKNLAVNVFTAIDERINKIEQNLQQAIQDRKNLGKNVLLEIEKLDADLDLTRQMIASLIELYKFTENLQTNSINQGELSWLYQFQLSVN